MKLIIMLICLMSSLTANALTTDAVSSAGWNNLSPSQQAEVIKQIADTNVTNKVQIADPQQFNQWVTLGEHIGQVFGGAAKEIGIATAEFIKTPIGFVTAAIIIGHFVGGVLMHICGAIVILIAGLSFVRWHSQKIRTIDIRYSTDKVDIFGRSRLESKELRGINEDWGIWYIFLSVFTVGVALITLFTS